MWDVVRGKALGTQAFPSPITAVVVDTLENILCAGSAEGTVFLNNLDAGMEDPFPKPDGPQIVLRGHRCVKNALLCISHLLLFSFNSFAF